MAEVEGTAISDGGDEQENENPYETPEHKATLLPVKFYSESENWDDDGNDCGDYLTAEAAKALMEREDSLGHPPVKEAVSVSPADKWVEAVDEDGKTP